MSKTDSETEINVRVSSQPTLLTCLSTPGFVMPHARRVPGSFCCVGFTLPPQMTSWLKYCGYEVRGAIITLFCPEKNRNKGWCQGGSSQQSRACRRGRLTIEIPMQSPTRFGYSNGYLGLPGNPPGKYTQKYRLSTIFPSSSQSFKNLDPP